MVYDSLLDIIKHTYGLGFVELVKVIGTEDGVKIEAMDNDRNVVLTGELSAPIDNFVGTVGLSRIGILNGYLNFSQFANKDAAIDIVSEGDKGPTEINFESTNGHTANYRFMGAAVAEKQIQIPVFKGAEWEVTVEPDAGALKDLAAMNNILGSFESAFSVKTIGNNLEFHIGSNTTDRTKIVFAKNISGALKHAWKFPLSHFLAISKLHDASVSTAISFSDRGALKIEVDSGMGVYTYILPARTN